MLRESGFETDFTEDIRAELWTKAAINAAINPISAILRLPNGALAEDPHIRELMLEAAREVARVATAEGVPLDENVVERSVLEVAHNTASNRSSMLQDMERMRPTEIDAITGRVVSAAARHGISAPINQALYALVRRLEARSDQGGPEPHPGEDRRL